MNYSKQEVGLIASYYFVIYALGKLINGFWSARIAGKSMLLIGIFGSVICTVLFGFGSELIIFTVLWSANAFFQSMGWISIISVMSQWFRAEQSGKVMGFMSLSYLIGDFLARSTAAFIQSTWKINWSGLFWIHAAIFTGIALVIIFLLKPSPGKLDVSEGLSSERNELYGKNEPDDNILWLKYLLKNAKFWLVCIIYLSISMIRYAFWIWSIVYLQEEAGLNLVNAILMSTIIPLLGAAGSIFCGWVSDKMSAMRGPILTVMMALLTISLYLFVNISAENHILLMIVLGLIGFTMYGPYSLIAGAMAIDFGSSRVASTAAGIMDAIGAFGAALMGAGMGYIVDKYGWNYSFILLTVISLIASLLCLSLWRLRPTTAEELLT